MNRRHATVIALLLGLAVLFGTFAAITTAHLGAASRSANNARIIAQERRLAAAERSLRQALTRPSAAPVAARHPRTVYVRPAPIIVHLHRHGDDGGDGGSSDD